MSIINVKEHTLISSVACPLVTSICAPASTTMPNTKPTVLTTAIIHCKTRINGCRNTNGNLIVSLPRSGCVGMQRLFVYYTKNDLFCKYIYKPLCQRFLQKRSFV